MYINENWPGDSSVQPSLITGAYEPCYLKSNPVLKAIGLIKETEVDINQWKDISCSWMKIINVVKMSILPKSID